MKQLLSDYTSGAQLATDLVNTDPRVRTAGEALPDPTALAQFLAAHELGDRRVAAAEVREVHRLRKLLRAIIESAEDELVDAANALVAAGCAGPQLLRDAAGRRQWWIVSRPDVSLSEEIGMAAGAGLLGVVHALGHDRFRRCASPVCDGVFVDSSRAGRRRFCMPEICGNRVNVANYRSRHR
ncbi:CGNR zinc finger domain-containing protein [Nocardia mexicana]|uniref:Putative RNA-binding Zn ribbon-like protein n=1 Tax=Nocardia mexicana TaxID=279262 RepID=A0A370GZY2_9NOCA|nr:CGNR zinc finger domain-containing protein [Nocardia mexicana]RDI49240.1 putative RNA-binding Zn ribbon-like protein [Nocardia mexicana]